MDSRHLKLYNEELYFIREMGKIFAKNNPKVAGSLGLGGNECSDPYVERLLEGFAFLTSRIQLQYEEEFPKFTQHLLDVIYPDFISPLPSSSIVQFNPDITGKMTEEGYLVKRNTKLLSPRIPNKKMQCEFRTTQDAMLWPIKINSVEYLLPEDLPNTISNTVPPDIFKNTHGTIKLSIKTTGDDINFSELKDLEELVFYLAGDGSQSGKIYESLLAHTQQIVFTDGKGEIKLLDKSHITPLGFKKKTSILPTTKRGFQGYRYLQEYFLNPKRFMFVSLYDCKNEFLSIHSHSLDIYFLLNSRDDDLRRTLGVDNFKLNCTPIINLFEKTASHVHLNKRPTNVKHRKNKKDVSHYLPGYPIIVDKSQPRNFEIYRVLDVKGLGNYKQEDTNFYPFYSLNHGTLNSAEQSFYTLQRHEEIRAIRDSDDSYHGNEIYISLAENTSNLPYSKDIKELRIKTLSTNRGLPLYFRTKNITFTTPDESLPVEIKNGICNIEDFTPPRPAHKASEHTWKLINLLSLNHLSIADESNSEESILALRELLELQIHTQRVGGINQQFIQVYKTQINRGLREVSTKKIVHPIYIQGKITYARGLQITITLDEEAFDGGSAFLFGSVLEQFFSQYTSINSFTQTIVKTLDRGEIMKWPIKKGTQQSL